MHIFLLILFLESILPAIPNNFSLENLLMLVLYNELFILLCRRGSTENVQAETLNLICEMLISKSAMHLNFLEIRSLE